MQRDIYDRSTYDAAQHLEVARKYFEADWKYHGALDEVERYSTDDEAKRECDEARAMWREAFAIMAEWETTFDCVNMSEDEYRDLMNGIAFDQYEAQQEGAILSHYEGGHDDDGCTIR